MKHDIIIMTSLKQRYNPFLRVVPFLSVVVKAHPMISCLVAVVFEETGSFILIIVFDFMFVPISSEQNGPLRKVRNTTKLESLRKEAKHSLKYAVVTPSLCRIQEVSYYKLLCRILRPLGDFEEIIRRIVMKFCMNDCLTLYRKTIREILENFQ